MHREISHTDPAWQRKSNRSLYLLTALLGLLIAIDLWPVIAAWAADQGLRLPTWPREIGGYRIVLLAAILGGARALYSSLEGPFEGRIGVDLAPALPRVAALPLGAPPAAP